MNIEIELIIIGGTDKTIKFIVVVAGKPTGELQTSREDFSKIAERLFEGTFKVVKSLPQGISMASLDEPTE